MSYTKTVNFSVKDTLASGDPNKIIKGAEINTEFNNIETAISTLTSTVSGINIPDTSSFFSSISSISASKVTVSANAFSSYYTAPNPGFVVLWYHGTPNIAAAANGAQTSVRNIHTFTDVHGSVTNIADTLHVLSVGFGVG